MLAKAQDSKSLIMKKNNLVQTSKKTVLTYYY